MRLLSARRVQDSVAANLRSQALEWFEDKSNRLPGPPFQVLIGWSDDYDSLLASEFRHRTDRHALIDVARREGRVLLSGRGGSGKTVLMRRLVARSLQDDGLVPVFVDLKRWSGLHYEEWERRLGKPGSGVHFLIDSCSDPPVDIGTLHAARPSLERLLVVDGLNEISAPVGQQILRALHDYVSYAVRTSVVAVDRMVRRDLPGPEPWSLAMVLPLDPDEVSRVLKSAGAGKRRPASTSLLTTPYFLDWALRQGQSSLQQTKADTLRLWFEKHSGVAQADLPRAAKAAYVAYRRTRSRTFPLRLFQRFAGPDATHALITSEALLQQGTAAYFDHHLKHDYLASLWVRNASERPRRPSATARLFNSVTFYASSFDTLAMALEQMSSQGQADTFVRAVYDWNPYGAAYSVAEAEGEGVAPVSPEMKCVLFAVLAERQQDLLALTARKAADALRYFPGNDARAFVGASLAEVFRLVKSRSRGVQWFSDWVDLFTLTDALPRDEDVDTLEEEDSVTGWTAANVFKRLPLTEAQQERIRQLCTHRRETVQWRAVHVLGAFPNERNLETLLGRLEARDTWVRFGAIRSLVEIAARAGEPQFRQKVFAALEERVQSISEDRRVVKELQSALFVAPARVPPDWLNTIEGLVESLHVLAETPEERDRWRDVGYDLRKAYGSRSR